MHHFNFLKIIATATAVMSLAGHVYADGDAKVYPGALAVKWSGVTPTYNSGAIGNPSSTSWMYMDLPVINDDTGSGIDSSWYKAIDRHYSSDIRCSINSVYFNNSAGNYYGSWGANISTSGSAATEQTKSTGSATGGSTRHEYFSCAIPPTYSGNVSYIISYQVSE